MAIGISNLSNTNAPDSDFPYGDLRDNPGDGSGTPVNRNMLSDSLQFFNKLMDEAGVSPNGVVDNEYSGWQLFDAFLRSIPKKIVFTWTSVFDGASHTINRTDIDAAVSESIPFYKGYGATTNNKIDFSIQLWWLDTGANTWKIIQTGASVEPVISVNATTGNITIVLNGAPISPAANVRAILIG